MLFKAKGSGQFRECLRDLILRADLQQFRLCQVDRREAHVQLRAQFVLRQSSDLIHHKLSGGHRLIGYFDECLRLQRLEVRLIDAQKYVVLRGLRALRAGLRL